MSEKQDPNAEILLPKKGPIRTLLLDDSAFDRTRIKRMTQRTDMEIEVIEAPSISAMSELMETEEFDLILIDYTLPEGNGLQALNLVQENKLNNKAATIMISGQEEMGVAVSAFRHGCNNFITKDELSENILKSAMEGALQAAKKSLPSGAEFAEAIKGYIDNALHESVKDGVVQSAVSEGLKQAIENLGYEAPKQDGKAIQDFWATLLTEDEFIYKP